MSHKSSRRKIGNIMSQVDPSRLFELYRTSTQNNSDLHHPGIKQRTANEEHVRRDFDTWYAGLQSGVLVGATMRNPQGQGQQQPSSGFDVQRGFGPSGVQRQGNVYDLFEHTQEQLFEMPSRTNTPQNVQQALQMAINALSTRSRVAA